MDVGPRLIGDQSAAVPAPTGLWRDARRSLPGLAVVGFLVWFATWGWATDFVWLTTGLPEYATWGRFYSLWIPLASYLFTVASILFSAGDAREARACIARQACASLSLLIFLLMELGWRGTGSWHVWFGCFFVAVVLVRGAAFFWPLWRDWTGLSSRRASIRIFVGSVLVYGLLAPWIVKTLPMAGDEPHYLLITHSILVDGDLDLRNNYEQKDYRSFHAGRLRPQGSEESVSAHGVGFPWLLLPGYALAGRLGATWVVALLAALLSVNLYWFALELSGSPKASLQAWAFCAFTIPIVAYAHQLFPEIAAALGTLYAYRQFRAHPFPSVGRLLGGVVATFAVAFVKARYAPITVALWIYVLSRRAGDRTWVARWALACLALLVSLPLIDWLAFDGFLMLRKFGTPIEWLYLLRPNLFHLVGPLGLLFDQKTGLLIYSPVYLIAFVGLTLLLRDRKPDGLVISLVGLTYLYLLIAHAQDGWHGEFSPSPRYLVVVLPLLAGPMAVALIRCRGRAFHVTRTILAAYSLLMATTLLVVPRWRFRAKTGQSMVLAAVGQALSMNLLDWFPSFIAPTVYTFALAGIGLALVGGFILYFSAVRDG